MELREWLIILGLALVTLIVIDGVRRLQRQRQVPRLDRAGYEPAAGATADPDDEDPEAAAREAELSWELPNGGARVVRPAEQSDVKPKPKLQRQDHPGPSRVLSEFRRQRRDDDEVPEIGGMAAASASSAATMSAASGSSAWSGSDTGGEHDVAAMPETREEAKGERREPELDIGAGSRADHAPEDERRSNDPAHEPLAADPDDHETYHDDDERYRLVDLEGMSDSLKSGSKRVGSSMQRFGSSLQKTLAERRDHKRQERVRKEQERAERKQREQAEREEQAHRDREAAEARAAREAERRRFEAETAERDDDPLFDGASSSRHDEPAPAAADVAEMPLEDDVVKAHPVLEKAMRHDVSAGHAREALSHAEEVIVISVMSRDEQGFSGAALLDLMLACGLRYGRDMGIFHRFETEDAESPLQFSMVNVVKPGTFPIHSMDDFHTPGVTLLMPLPSASDTSAAFEAMVETAMVIVRHLGGELKDEHMSVMTAQTVEFARQRVQEFERRNRLHRYQVN